MIKIVYESKMFWFLSILWCGCPLARMLCSGSDPQIWEQIFVSAQFLDPASLDSAGLMIECPRKLNVFSSWHGLFRGLLREALLYCPAFTLSTTIGWSLSYYQTGALHIEGMRSFDQLLRLDYYLGQVWACESCARSKMNADFVAWSAPSMLHTVLASFDRVRLPIDLEL